MSNEPCNKPAIPALSLATGDPAGDKPASFTRFILPFNYSVDSILNFKESDEGQNSGKSGVTYQQLDTSGSSSNTVGSLESALARRLYLTNETGNILFDRAKWLQIADWSPCQQTRETTVRNHKIRITMSPPQIVLFHWPVHTNRDIQKDSGTLQTGFLIIQLYYPDNQPDDCQIRLEDHLDVNELFRYCRKPYEGHDCYNSDFYSFISNLWLPEAQSSKRMYEDRWLQWVDHARLQIDGRHYCLQLTRNGSQSGWMTQADDRAFVWTCALLPQGAKSLQTLFNEKSLLASKQGYWIRLLNVDRSANSCYDNHSLTQFQSDWADSRTYKRWEEDGTFYGFSYHSGAMLGPSDKELPLWKHFGQMYFDQILLLFYVRVSLFRFSSELCEISNKVNDLRDVTTWMKRFQLLRLKFSIFTNLYQFPLISNQQQGVEMYEIARKFLDVQPLFEEIQSEIHNSHDYFLQHISHKQSTTTSRLTVVATVGLIISFFLAIMGIDGISDIVEGCKNSYYSRRGSLWLIIFGLIAVFIQGFIILLSPKLDKFIERIANILSKDI